MTEELTPLNFSVDVPVAMQEDTNTIVHTLPTI